MATVHIQAPEPYFTDGQVTLYHGRLEDVLPRLGVRPDLVIADPPYGETALAWDRWPTGWPAIVAEHASSLWCFGSMRMFLDRRDEFAAWKLSQDVIWEKHNGSGFATDRFSRIHEHALHWYRGDWSAIHHQTPKVARIGPRVATAVKVASGPGIHSSTGAAVWEDDGTRWQATVIRARSMHRLGTLNPTEKPTGLLEPLISYGCPPGGLVLDVFAGSCSTLIAARNLGRPAIGIEMREEQCELAARRLEQGVLSLEGL